MCVCVCVHVRVCVCVWGGGGGGGGFLQFNLLLVYFFLISSVIRKTPLIRLLPVLQVGSRVDCRVFPVLVLNLRIEVELTELSYF